MSYSRPFFRHAVALLCLIALAGFALERDYAQADDSNIGRWGESDVFGDDGVGRFPTPTSAPEISKDAPEIASRADGVANLPRSNVVDSTPQPLAIDTTPVESSTAVTHPQLPPDPGEVQYDVMTDPSPAIANLQVTGPHGSNASGCPGWFNWRNWCDADAWFHHGHPDDSQKHIGKGQPLKGTSWLNRPYSTSLMVGGMITDDLNGPVAMPENSGVVSFALGYDFDHYWGSECRVAGGTYDIEGGNNGETSDVLLLDSRLLFYPWGDSRVRPYYGLGLGLGNFQYVDLAGNAEDAWVPVVPLSIGLKYQYSYTCVLRADLTHYFSPKGGGVDEMDNVSMTFGVELRGGGKRRSYFPWNPSPYLY